MGWIEIPHWSDFQHYRDRDPVWIKNYTRLLHDPNYRGLSGHQRGVLHGLWLEYASSHAQLPLDTRSLSSQLSLRVFSEQLEALNHAGFIVISASKPLASRAPAPSREGEKRDKPHPPQPPPPDTSNGTGDGGLNLDTILRPMGDA